MKILLTSFNGSGPYTTRMYLVNAKDLFVSEIDVLKLNRYKMATNLSNIIIIVELDFHNFRLQMLWLREI